MQHMATDYRMIINEVRAALEEKAAREMYGLSLIHI